MIDPNDYLSVQLRVGTRRVEVVNRDGRVVMISTGTSDGNAIRKLSNLVDALIADRQEKQE